MDKQSHNFSLEETMVLSNCQWSFLPQVPDRWISGTATTRAWATWARSIRSIGSITWRDDFVVLKRMNTFVWEPSSASHFSLKPLQNSQIKSSNQSRDQEISWKFIQWIGCRMGRIVLFSVGNNLKQSSKAKQSIAVYCAHCGKQSILKHLFQQSTNQHPLLRSEGSFGCGLACFMLRTWRKV